MVQLSFHPLVFDRNYLLFRCSCGREAVGGDEEVGGGEERKREREMDIFRAEASADIETEGIHQKDQY